MIELPIYHHDDHSNELDKLGIKTSLEHAETKPMMFFNISAIGYYKDDDITCSLIHSNGMSFVCPYTYDQIKSIIHERGA